MQKGLFYNTAQFRPYLEGRSAPGIPASEPSKPSLYLSGLEIADGNSTVA